jgi:hypothetical protein
MTDTTSNQMSEDIETDGSYKGFSNLSKRQIAKICRIVADAIDHEGEVPGNLIKDLEHLSGMYKGYKNAYHTLNAEVGRFRAYSAPYVRPDEAVKGLDKKPSIFLVTLPKSATVYIANSIASTLGYTLSSTVVSPTFPKNIVWAPMIHDFMRGGMVSVSHMQPDVFNMRGVKQAGLRKGVLHLRDPRATLLSWVHFLDKRGARHESGFGSIENPAGVKFQNMPFEERTDACIDHFFMHSVAWIENWLEQLKIDPRLNFLIVRHDDLISDEEAYFNRIMKFYDLNSKVSTVVSDETTHFRSGNNNEWREVLTSAQIERMNNAIPNWMFERFGWVK